MTAVVLALDSAACRDPQVVGAKAARLAAARAAGLPVPDSLAVPCADSGPLLAAAARRAVRDGVHAGRLQVMSASKHPLAGLPAAARALGPALAVRSSAPGEADPLLAGAFSSLLGVAPDEVPTAALAVWASAIRDQSGAAPLMGVLLQPELRPDFAGAAHAGADGTVTVSMIDGAAAPLMSGWEPGITVGVGPGGELAAAARPLAAGEAAAAQGAAGLARRVCALLGSNLIEWARCGQTTWLLQCDRLTAGDPWAAGRPHAGLPAAQHNSAQQEFAQDRAAVHRAVLRAARYAGPFGERWVVPWAVAWPGKVHVADAPGMGEPERSFAVVRELSEQLTRQVWGERLASGLAAGLRAGRPLQGVPGTPEPALVAAFAAACSRLGGDLRHRGVLHAGDQLWTLPAAPAAAAAGTGRPAHDRHAAAAAAALSWEPWLYEAVRALGSQASGSPSAPGIGCGTAVQADAGGLPGSLPPRCVIVTRYALPRLAPLLMGAAGLVTANGGEGAHLVTVARSLGVPVVSRCDLAPMVRAGRTLVAVDGDAGVVSVLAADADGGGSDG